MLFPIWLVAAVISKPPILRLLGNYLHVSYSLFQCKGDFHAKQVIFLDYLKTRNDCFQGFSYLMNENRLDLFQTPTLLLIVVTI